jgi:hypothetical protein
MAFADELPEDAKELQPEPVCVCRVDWVTTPASVKEWKNDITDGLNQPYPRSFPAITYSADCKVTGHAEQAGYQKVFDNL